jgi:hypothetical protein
MIKAAHKDLYSTNIRNENFVVVLYVATSSPDCLQYHSRRNYRVLDNLPGDRGWAISGHLLQAEFAANSRQ